MKNLYSNNASAVHPSVPAWRPSLRRTCTEETVVQFSWSAFNQLSAKLPTINVHQNPTFVVLDIGCTKPMGSRPAVMAFAAASKRFGIVCQFLPTYSEFSFANSELSAVYEKCRIWFPTTPKCYTDVDILDKGSVPILLSLGQMRNLRFTLDMNPYLVMLTCPAFGMKRKPLHMSTSRHLVLDLATIQYSPCPENCFFVSKDEAFVAKSPGSAKTPGCKACEGKHVPHIPTCPKYQEFSTKEVLGPIPDAPKDIRTVFTFADGSTCQRLDQGAYRYVTLSGKLVIRLLMTLNLLGLI